MEPKVALEKSNPPLISGPSKNNADSLINKTFLKFQEKFYELLQSFNSILKDNGSMVDNKTNLDFTQLLQEFINSLVNLEVILKFIYNNYMIAKDSNKYCPSPINLISRPEVVTSNESINYANYTNLLNSQVNISQQLKESLENCIKKLDNINK